MKSLTYLVRTAGLGIIAGLSTPVSAGADASDWTDTVTLSGDLRLRYEAIDEDGEANRRRGRYRARLGLAATPTDDIKLVLQLATGADDPVSRNQSFDDGFSTKDIGIEMAYVDWTVNEALHVLGGKMKNPLHRAGGTPLVWDSDLNPEGIAVTYASGRFFAAAAGFAVDERSSSSDSLLFALQGGIKLRVSNAGELTAGLGYYDYTNTVANAPFYDGSANGNSVDTDGNLLFDYNELEVFAEYGTTLGELPVSAFLSVVQNTEVDRFDTGYTVGLKAGKASARGTWEAAWSYQDIEADAVVGTFSDSDFGGGGTDASGHILKAKYAVNPNVALAATLFVNEVDADAGNRHDYSRLQLDIEFKFD